MKFTYSKEAELNELQDRLEELSKLSVENVTVEDIENGIYSNQKKIDNVNAAITAHMTASNAEYEALVRKENAEKTLLLKQNAYSLSVRYVAALKEVLKVVDEVKGGYDYNPHFDFELLQASQRKPFEMLITKAERGLNSLKQFEV